MLPKAEFEVSEDSTEDLLKRCGNGDVDVGIMALPTTAKGLTIEPLFNEEMLVALSADNPLCESSELVMSDLVDQPFFRLRDVSGLGQSIDAWGGGDDSGRLLLGRIEQLTMIQLLVAQDQGVSCVPEMASAIDLDRRIVYRRLDPQRPSRTVAICFNPQRYQSQLATKFIATVKAFCSADSFSPRNLISPAG
jgi:LysR family hydrogen peroxide-inducible transcriptional activator